MLECEVSQIDLSAWLSSPSEAEKERMAQTWHQAFSSHGLIYLTNHGLDSQYQETYRELCAAKRIKMPL